MTVRIQAAKKKLRLYTLLSILVHVCSGYYFISNVVFSIINSRNSSEEFDTYLIASLVIIQISFVVCGALISFLNYKKYKTIEEYKVISFSRIVVIDSILGCLIAIPYVYIPLIDVAFILNDPLGSIIVLCTWICLFLISQIIPYVVITKRLNKLCEK